MTTPTRDELIAAAETIIKEHPEMDASLWDDYALMLARHVRSTLAAEWSAELPTEPGAYWWRCNERDHKRAVVEVMPDGSLDGYGGDTPADHGGEWFPISKPE